TVERAATHRLRRGDRLRDRRDVRARRKTQAAIQRDRQFRRPLPDASPAESLWTAGFEVRRCDRIETARRRWGRTCRLRARDEARRAEEAARSVPERCGGQRMGL